MTEPVATVPPRPMLTKLILQVADEEGHPGVVGMSYVRESTHTYRFVSPPLGISEADVPF